MALPLDHDFNLDLPSYDIVSEPSFEAATASLNLHYAEPVNYTIAAAPSDVVLYGPDVTIDGDLIVNGNLKINGNITAQDCEISIDNNTIVNFFDMKIENNKVYINGKLVKSPTEIGMYILRRINAEDDAIKSIDDIL